MAIVSASIIISVQNNKIGKETERIQAELNQSINELSSLLDSLEYDTRECIDIALSLQVKARIMDSLLVQMKNPRYLYRGQP